MKKILIPIITFVAGIFLTVSATAIYKAEDIEFVPTDENWGVNNVSSAIKDLYDNRVSAIYLGTGTSFDVKEHLPKGIDYTELTADNFVVESTGKTLTTITGYSSGGSNSDYIQGSASLTKNYDASTGILNSYYNVYAIGHLYSSGSGTWYTKPINWNLDVKAYLIIGEIK